MMKGLAMRVVVLMLVLSPFFKMQNTMDLDPVNDGMEVEFASRFEERGRAASRSLGGGFEAVSQYSMLEAPPETLWLLAKTGIA